MTGKQETTFEALKRLIAPFNTTGIAIQPGTDISADLNIDSVSVQNNYNFVIKYSLNDRDLCAFKYRYFCMSDLRPFWEE